MAIVASIASSFLDKPILDGSVVLGEIGLTGEVRAEGATKQLVYQLEG